MTKKYDYTGWSKEDLIKRIHDLEKRKKYGLVWDEEREPEQVVLQCLKELPVLKEVKEKEIKNDHDKPTHILIEGDNYHALSVLNYTHENSVDVIYIDPPYNTGAKDWKYNNNYVDINDQWRHSKWLSFMEKRLVLSKHLLKNTGILICTIDKNEQANLGVLLREIFFEKEIVCVTIIHNPGGIQGNNFSHTNEYANFIHPLNGIYISKVDRDDVPPTAFRDWGKESSKRKAAKTCFYPIFIKDDSIIGFGDICQDDFHPNNSNIKRNDEIIEIYPIDKKGIERKWRFGRETVEDIKSELICKNIKGEYSIFRKKKEYRWKTVWTDNKYNANVYGTKLLNKIIDVDFPYPKSLFAVIDCIKAVKHNKDNSIILDFFAGSGTTLHAVCELNNEDNGSRQCILVTNNENNICDEVTYPRGYRVINGFIDNKGEVVLKSTNDNLKYYRTDFVPAEPTDENKEKLTLESIEMLCLRENTFDFVLEDGPIKIFRSSDKYTAILFEQSEINKLKSIIREYEKPVHVYIFSLGDDHFTNEFSDISTKVTVKAIPAAILRVYKRIFK